MSYITNLKNTEIYVITETEVLLKISMHLFLENMHYMYVLAGTYCAIFYEVFRTLFRYLPNFTLLFEIIC